MGGKKREKCHRKKMVRGEKIALEKINASPLNDHKIIYRGSLEKIGGEKMAGKKEPEYRTH